MSDGKRFARGAMMTHAGQWWWNRQSSPVSLENPMHLGRASLVSMVATLGVLAWTAGATRAAAPGDPQADLGSSTATDADVVAFIDAQIRQGWNDNKLRPSSEATDGEWCRRVYLDVLGRIPSVEELLRFERDRSKNKKASLVETLLDSDEYVEEYARNATTKWSNLLIGRAAARPDRRSMVNRAGMQQYLRRAFLENKPYDRLAYELISAQGVSTPGDPEYNGAVNFLLGNLQENATTATAKTARYFLGLQVQCTQCHNHPFNDWKQNQFWELNAFFRQTRGIPTREGRMVASARLIDEDFAGESRRDPRKAEIYYELRNGYMQAAYPKFVDGTSIDASGYVDEVNRREELARLIARSEYLGQAIANRTWSRFFGYGFTKPIDDMGPHNPPSHPDLLAGLAKAFASQGYDLKRLTRWIVLSEAYGLSSVTTTRNKSDDPSLGTKPAFSHFYLRQMEAEELYESLLVATEAHKSAGSFAAQEQVKGQWLQQFVQAFGTDEGDESTTFNGTIPQMLMMMNGELIRRAASGEKGSFLERLAHGNQSGSEKITRLYQASLSRRPTSYEIRAANTLLQLNKGSELAALQDVWWALLNSNEFILNH